MGQNSQISWVLLGKIYCVLSMIMGMYMPKNHELFLPGIPKNTGPLFFVSSPMVKNDNNKNNNKSNK